LLEPLAEALAARLILDVNLAFGRLADVVRLARRRDRPGVFVGVEVRRRRRRRPDVAGRVKDRLNAKVQQLVDEVVIALRRRDLPR